MPSQGRIDLREPTASVLAVGTELTTGMVLDTNSRDVARELSSVGIRVVETVCVPDSVEEVSSALARLMRQSGLVVITGGLGPTGDDLTREAVARATGRELVRDSEFAQRLSQIAAAHGTEAAGAGVLSQADILDGAEILHPTSGTAPGQILSLSSTVLALLPGPPGEMRPMLAELASRLGRHDQTSVTVSCVGVFEADAEAAALQVLQSYPGIELGLTATAGRLALVLRSHSGLVSLYAAARAVADALGEACYDVRGRSLEEVVLARLAQAGLTCAAAESCTGGLLSAALTTVPGASSVFLGSVVAYSNEAKSALLGVGASTLEEHGAVSEAVAEEMALGARAALGADFALAITGVAGPDGGTEAKPVGTVCFALCGPAGVRVSRTRLLRGDREGIRARAVAYSLDLLRLNLPDDGE